MLWHLVYISKRLASTTDHDITAMLHKARQQNQSLGITGVLLYSPTKFAQCLEGEYKPVVGLYEKIKADQRHYGVTMLHLTPVAERVFPAWFMGAKQLDEEQPIGLASFLAPAELETFQKMWDNKVPYPDQTVSLMQKFFN
jgi:hypothetical protein